MNRRRRGGAGGRWKKSAWKPPGSSGGRRGPRDFAALPQNLDRLRRSRTSTPLRWDLRLGCRGGFHIRPQRKTPSVTPAACHLPRGERLAGSVRVVGADAHSGPRDGEPVPYGGVWGWCVNGLPLRLLPKAKSTSPDKGRQDKFVRVVGAGVLVRPGARKNSLRHACGVPPPSRGRLRREGAEALPYTLCPRNKQA